MFKKLKVYKGREHPHQLITRRQSERVRRRQCKYNTGEPKKKGTIAKSVWYRVWYYHHL
jgi:hypothetical protein